VKQIAEEIRVAADEIVDALLGMPASRNVCILDSCGARPPDGRFLIAGFDPVEVVEADETGINLHTGQSTVRLEQESLLEVLDERLVRFGEFPIAGHHGLPAHGACIATFAYEFGYKLERIRRTTSLTENNAGPLARLAFFSSLVIHDYESSRTYITSSAGTEALKTAKQSVENALSIRRRPAGGENLPIRRHSAEVDSNFTRAEYKSAVNRIKEYIAAGDIYQANLTQQFTTELADHQTSEALFLELRRENPASFAAFIRCGRDVIVSASPERFLRIDIQGNERRVEAWPIKGTRPRTGVQAEDARLREELLNSAKDRAENVMIVDLLRNDLGRVCTYGSVEVPELFTLQEHPTLYHLVSKVRGTLRPEITAGALLRATFPCGSITGAPKIRAMEIIYEMERAARGISMGSIGYFSFDGRADLNVAIRTISVRDRIARFNAGGGIVAESDADAEYDESLLKAKALLRALKSGERVRGKG
jgi:para-aminobenzoate synthetase component I